LSGYAYDLGSLATALPFTELKRRSLVAHRAHAAAAAPDFRNSS
jgi:hypothetical protein